MKILITTLFLTLAVAPVTGQSLFGSRGKSNSASMFEDRRAPRASRIGDILTVLVMETTSASNRSLLDISKEAGLDWSGPGGLKLPGFSLSGDLSNEYKGEGTTSRSQCALGTIRSREDLT